MWFRGGTRRRDSLAQLEEEDRGINQRYFWIYSRGKRIEGRSINRID